MRKHWMFALAGVAVALVLATLASPFASSHPDGLEKVGEDQGFAEHAAAVPVWRAAFAPDYAFPGMTHEGTATALAGFAGTLAVFGAGLGLAKLLAHKPRPDGGD